MVQRAAQERVGINRSQGKARMEEPKTEMKGASSEKDAKAPNLFERAKEEVEAVIHSNKSPRHHKETHGRRDDIDKTTPIDEVKAPGVFGRVKEEIEALVGAIHPKRDNDSANH